uniref:Ribosomal protein L34 n=1 Tax=Odontella aurita TaxID=265563 RepID=A0A7S4MVZ7_9STRA|mmetsp:Transcript_35799/g.106845  ORF Transcript_35799/g.106845 Transcript_35799/m.106845 type:complete len:148 (+) Transcript_35799:120-563(+)
MLCAAALGRRAIATAASSLLSTSASSLAPVLGQGAKVHLTSAALTSVSGSSALTSSAAGPPASLNVTITDITSPSYGLGLPFPRFSLLIDDVLTSLLSPAWYIKRTYQPSIIKKRRRHGFLRRHESVGGRRMIKRRLARGRKRAAGC